MTDPIIVRLDSRVRLLVDAVTEACLLDLHDEFTHNNPAFHKMQAMGHRFTKEPKRIKTWRHEQANEDDPAWLFTAPRGGLQRVRDVLKTHGYTWTIRDDRTTGANLGSYTGDWVTGTLFPEHLVTPWEHQEDAIQAMLTKQNAVVRAPTGSGKTSAVIGAIARAQLPTIVIVWDTKLMEQWVDRLVVELGLDRSDIGIIKGKKRVLKPVTVAMQQTLNRFKPADWDGIRGKFGLVACDEVQRYSATTFTETIDQFPAKYRIGVSADETRKDGKEFLIYDMFGPVAFEVQKAALEAKGIIHNVEIRMVPTNFRAPWYVSQRNTKGATPDFRMLLTQMTEDDDRNAIAVKLAVEAAKTDPTFVFTHRVEHARTLDAALTAAGVKSGVMIGADENAAEFAKTKDGLRDGTVKVGVGTYQAIGVGQDVANVATGVCSTPMHTNRQFQDQVKGRICRKSPGKLRAIMYYLWDQHVHGYQAIRNLKRWNRQVAVLDGGQWVPAAEYMKGHTDPTQGDKEDERLDGIFVGG